MHHNIVNFWSLNESDIAQVGEKPIQWWTDFVLRLSNDLAKAETLQAKCDISHSLSAVSQHLFVRVMAELTKDAPGRKLKSA